MPDKKSFKVIIAGGGISGLSLANMLQKNGIDYILLEAYPDIAPQVGASIGLLPHGTRVLDQLGMYEDIRKLVSPLDHFFMRNDKGELIADHKGAAESFIERHGYPMLFLDRQMVLQVLYDHLDDKSKVLTKKRFKKVDVKDGGVEVTTEDGFVCTGDILVGADGIHSRVRREMCRIANGVSEEGISTSEETEVPCDYGCIFGISSPCAGIKAGSATAVFRHHNSYLILGGLHDRVFWFHFFRIGKKRVYGDKIPKYTKEDKAAKIKERQNDPIMPGLTFGDIAARAISSNITPLAEYTYKKWHFGRIITIGDAAHKFEPIGGQGGNAAIETAAVLVNKLAKHLHKPSIASLNDAQISSIFDEVQNTRYGRVQKLIADSHEHQRIDALDTPFHKFLALKILPRTDTENVLFNLSRNVPQGKKLDMVDIPARPRLIPYDDELQSEPNSRGWRGWLIAAVFVALSVIGYWGMHMRTAELGLSDYLRSTTANLKFADNGASLRNKYTSIAAIDNALAFVVSFFMPGTAKWDQGLWILQLYFLGSFFAIVAVWSVEACRKRNALTLISFTSIWACAYQGLGIAVVGPLYCVAYLLTSKDESYWWPLSRQISTPVARSLLPALLLGYMLPTILMFLPYSDPNTTQGMIAFWQPAPIYVNILLSIFSTVYARKYPQKHTTPKAGVPMPDMHDLKLIYLSTFALLTMLHFGTVLTIHRSPQLLFIEVFIPSSRTREPSTVQGLRSLWQVDFWTCWMTSLLWCCVGVWDLKRVGRTNVELGKAVVGIILATIFFGPGASLVGFWYWRELKMARTSFK